MSSPWHPQRLHIEVVDTWIPILWALATSPVVAGALKAPHTAWTAFVAYELGCALAATVGRGTLGSRPRGTTLLLWWLVSLGAVVGFGSLAYALGFRPVPSLAWSAWGLVPPVDLPLLLLYVGLNPWVEEWFWRGTLLRDAVRRRLGVRGARGLASLGFVPFHVVFLVASFGPMLGSLVGATILLIALGWVALRERQGHAWCAVASHGGADLGVVTLYVLFLRGAPSAG